MEFVLSEVAYLGPENRKVNWTGICRRVDSQGKVLVEKYGPE